MQGLRLLPQGGEGPGGLWVEEGQGLAQVLIDVLWWLLLEGKTGWGGLGLEVGNRAEGDCWSRRNGVGGCCGLACEGPKRGQWWAISRCFEGFADVEEEVRFQSVGGVSGSLAHSGVDGGEPGQVPGGAGLRRGQGPGQIGGAGTEGPGGGCTMLDAELRASSGQVGRRWWSSGLLTVWGSREISSSERGKVTWHEVSHRMG